MDSNNHSPRIKSKLVQIPIQPIPTTNTISLSVQSSQPVTPTRQIRPAQPKSQNIQIVQAGQQAVVLGNNQNIIQLQNPQQSGQRVVFLQPVGTSNGQIAYIHQSPKTEPNHSVNHTSNLSFIQSTVIEQNVKTERRENHPPEPTNGQRKVTYSENDCNALDIRRATPVQKPFNSSYILPASSSPLPPPTLINNGSHGNGGGGGGANSSSRGCNCSKSKCLKLYCECFRRGEYCSPACQCNHCHNREEYNDLRQKAVRLALDRNEDAFKPKVAKSGKQVNKKGKHLRGCNCKRSGCLKKYCECYQAGVACYDLCNCMGCKNREDHDPLADYGAPSSKRVRIGVSRVLQTNLTGPIISSATNCLLKAARSKQRIGASKLATDSAVLEQFGKSIREIISHTITKEREPTGSTRVKPN